MDKHERRMLIRREKIRQDQQELRGKRHREARERLMELQVRQIRSQYGIGGFILAYPAQGGRSYVLDEKDSWYRLVGKMAYRDYIIWIKMRRTHDQLLDEWKKRMTLRGCKAIKEELMANRWHPDRVEKMLEAGTLEQLW
jgi:mRNA-degrading endonuclease HigB of HigAB toxin-antitoxin module